MPANLVKPGEEKYWERAKKQAAEQGHAEDWPYIVGIFEKMTANKSLEKAGPYVDRPYHGHTALVSRRGRWPGGVPDMDAVRMAQRRPSPQARLDEIPSGKPVLRVSNIVDNLGLDAAQQRSYEKTLGELLPEANEVVLRQALMTKMQHDRLDPAQRREMLGRALSFRRGVLQKSGVVVQSLEDYIPEPSEDRYILEKSSPRGGKYHRRVPRKNGKGYTYYYDEEKYNRSRNAHVSGDSASRQAIKSAVQKRLESGDADVKEFGSLVRRYGSQLVGEVLEKERSEGRMEFQKGRLRLVKSERFVLMLE